MTLVGSLVGWLAADDFFLFFFSLRPSHQDDRVMQRFELTVRSMGYGAPRTVGLAACIALQLASRIQGQKQRQPHFAVRPAHNDVKRDPFFLAPLESISRPHLLFVLPPRDQWTLYLYSFCCMAVDEKAVQGRQASRRALRRTCKRACRPSRDRITPLFNVLDSIMGLLLFAVSLAKKDFHEEIPFLRRKIFPDMPQEELFAFTASRRDKTLSHPRHLRTYGIS